jgi:hypothetical protein
MGVDVVAVDLRRGDVAQHPLIIAATSLAEPDLSWE